MRGLRGMWIAVVALLAGLAAVQAQTTTVPLARAEADPDDLRWADIGGKSYSSAFRGSFSYANTAVDVVYEPTQSGAFIEGALTGGGLKPNFSYQLKLEGKPTTLYHADGDDLANEAIGFAGRWWADYYDATGTWVSGKNITDTQYTTVRDAGFVDGAFTCIVKGYLLFGNLVTDGFGNVVQDGAVGAGFFVDSSLHVTWNTVLNTRLPEPEDTDITYYTFKRNNAAAYYPTSTRSTTVGLYGEWEPGRALPGTLEMPSGTYNVRLVLTEDSFHTTNGNWATVLYADIAPTFTYVAPPPVVYYGGLTGTVVGTTYRAIRGAVVTVTGPATAQATTNTKGKFTFASLPEGDYAVRITAAGYAPGAATAQVVRNVTTPTSPAIIVLSAAR